MGFLQTIQQTKTDGRCSGKLIRQSDQLVCGGGKSEVLVRQAARVVRDQGEANPVVANVYIRMMASLLGRAGHLVDKATAFGKVSNWKVRTSSPRSIRQSGWAVSREAISAWERVDMLAPGKANWQFHLVQMREGGSGVRTTPGRPTMP